MLRYPPRMREVKGGALMASFKLEVPRTFATADGERMESSYIPVVAFEALATQVEAAAPGSVVFVTGPLKTFAGKTGSGWQVKAEALQVVRRPAAAAAAA